nr:recombinase family protein [Tessaracoccus palaemonis]
MRLAFEMYAAGDATLEDIQSELTDRGLRTRATQRRPAGPISVSKIHQLLQDPYYVGIVSYKGDEYSGRHEPLIDRDLFDEVQDLMASRGRAGERRRVVHHYLKGTLWCGACWHRDQTIRRMIIRRTISRSGDEYLYFFCRGTQDGTCNAKYSNVQRVEDAVAEHCRTVQFTPDFIHAMRQSLADALTDQEASQHALKEQLESQLARLDTQESNLLDLAIDDTIPKDKIRAKLREIGVTRERLNAQLAAAVDTLTDAVEFISVNLRLLENPYELYRHGSDEVRRRLNQAIFTRVFIDHDEITGHALKAPLDDLLTVQTTYHANSVAKSCEEPPPGIEPFTWSEHHPATTKEGAAHKGDSFTSTTLRLPTNLDHRVPVSSKPHLVGLTGFEPATP